MLHYSMKKMYLRQTSLDSHKWASPLDVEVEFFFSIKLNAVLTRSAPVAQLVEHRAIMREVAGSNPGWINTQDLKITEEKMLPL